MHMHMKLENGVLIVAMKTRIPDAFSALLVDLATSCVHQTATCQQREPKHKRRSQEHVPITASGNSLLVTVRQVVVKTVSYDSLQFEPAGKS